jgi:hypothetical protein
MTKAKAKRWTDMTAKEQERHVARQASMVRIGWEAVKTRYPYGAQVPEWFWQLHEQTEIKAERAVNKAAGDDDAAWHEMYAKTFPKMLANALANRCETTASIV